jgi:hypothetical protein
MWAYMFTPEFLSVSHKTPAFSVSIQCCCTVILFTFLNMFSTAKPSEAQQSTMVRAVRAVIRWLDACQIPISTRSATFVR